MPEQHPPPCIGGQGTVPQEQKTQQSPGLGRTVVKQCGQVQKKRQASVGMVSVVCAPQCGQVRVEVSTGSGAVMDGALGGAWQDSRLG
jgi:hypothetical protein